MKYSGKYAIMEKNMEEKMKLLIDADGCPVTNIAVRTADRMCDNLRYCALYRA